ncbi:MAG TPA: DUF4304 domain-containing protein [Ignavibacteria bacterium]|nr:DUF4304 domain-containing protein [Ignavibacteria bacterium]HMR42053.1 DUF4304 domain-containing protein [Ignavibacteria bacterium]
MTVNNLFNQYLKGIEMFFRDQGFKRNGYCFHQKRFENLILLNIQKSNLSTTEVIEFTFNIGICSVYLLSFYQIEDKLPETDDWHWRKRIGNFLPANEDVWLKISETTNIQELVKYSIELFNKYVFPELRNNSTDEELVTQWLNKNSPGLTEFQRLLNLTALLSKTNLDTIYLNVKSELLNYAQKNRLSISYHLNKLDEVKPD